MDDHKLVLLPVQQHVLLNGPVMGMWCETCKKWYYRRNDKWPTVCPSTIKQSISQSQDQ